MPPRSNAVVNRAPIVPTSPRNLFSGPVSSPLTGSTLITPNPSLDSPQFEWDSEQEELIGFNIEEKENLRGISKLNSTTRDNLLDGDLSGLGFTSEEEAFASPNSFCDTSSCQLEVTQVNSAVVGEMDAQREFTEEVAKINRVWQKARDAIDDFPVESVNATAIPFVDRDLDKIETKVLEFRQSVRDLKQQFSETIPQDQLTQFDQRVTDLLSERRNHKESIRARVLEIAPPQQMSQYEFEMVKLQKEILKLQTESRDHAKTSRKSEALVKADSIYDVVEDRASQFLMDIALGDEYASWEEVTDNDIRRAMNSKAEWKNTLDQVIQDFQKFKVLVATNDPDQMKDSESKFSLLKEQVNLAQTCYEKAIVEIEEEDAGRNIYTLDKDVVSKLEYPRFAGRSSECFIKFKEKFERALRSNRVPLIDQADKLREHLSGDALKHVPDSIKDIKIAFKALHELYGDPNKIVAQRLKDLKKLGKLPSEEGAGHEIYTKQMHWYLSLEQLVQDLVDLGDSDEDLAYSVFT